MATIFITGANSGIGLETALHMARRGHRVIAGCRNPDAAADLLSARDDDALDLDLLKVDLLDQGSMQSTIDALVEREGGLDVLVSNAGIGGGRSLEETPMDEFREVFETNVFGTITLMQAVIPHFRRQASGRLVNVTSLAAVNVFGCHGTYSSSKAAVETVCTALSQELAAFNVHVSLIEPGCIMTPMWEKGSMPPEDSPYQVSFGRLMKFGEFGLGRAATTADCAAAIQDAIESDTPRFRYPVGPDAEDFFRAYTALNDDEEWRRIARLDNAAYAERMQELMGVDYYA
jgi:NAD(P)-dependent dehydrogenase (short-subunit alcohol dehydrogenase family)